MKSPENETLKCMTGRLEDATKPKRHGKGIRLEDATKIIGNAVYAIKFS